MPAHSSAAYLRRWRREHPERVREHSPRRPLATRPRASPRTLGRSRCGPVREARPPGAMRGVRRGSRHRRAWPLARRGPPPGLLAPARRRVVVPAAATSDGTEGRRRERERRSRSRRQGCVTYAPQDNAPPSHGFSRLRPQAGGLELAHRRARRIDSSMPPSTKAEEEAEAGADGRASSMCEFRDGKTFVVTTLPDDPQASEQAARERTLDQSGEHKQRAK